MTATIVGPGGKIEVENDQGPPITVTDADAIAILEQIEGSVGSVVPAEWDDIILGYTGSNLTSVVYKLAGVTLRSLTLTYSGVNLVRVQAA